MHVNGTVAGTGGYNALSDVRFKKDIASLADSLVKILAVRGVIYKWIDEKQYGGETQIGVIAQEIENIISDVVSTGKDGIKRVRYTDLVPVVIEAMKEMKHGYDAELRVLKDRADRAEADNARLRAALCSKFADLDGCGD